MSAFLYSPPAAEPFVFVHFPKSGGSSVREAIGYLCRRKLVRRGSEGWPWRRSFAALRDPVERFLSGWEERAPRWELGALLRLLLEDRVPAWRPGAGRGDIKHHLARLAHPVNARFFEAVSEGGGRFVCTGQLDSDFPAVIGSLGVAAGAIGRAREQPGRRRWEDLSRWEQRRLAEYLQPDYAMLRAVPPGRFVGAPLALRAN